MKTNIHFWFFHAQFFLKWEMFKKKGLLEMNTRILRSITFFPKIGLCWDNLEKYCRAIHDADDNMAHAHYILDT
jgi:hypothetical protein